MHVITTNNPNDGLHQALWHLKVSGIETDSRNGKVVRSPGPVATVYLAPERRVLFSPLRDANPFFHLYESIWMMAGNNDVASVAQYASTMNAFADGGTMWGAYGFRWREFFGFDQITELVNLLRKDPSTRRAVLAMWSPSGDLVAEDIKAKRYDVQAAWAKAVAAEYPDAIVIQQGAPGDAVCRLPDGVLVGAWTASTLHEGWVLPRTRGGSGSKDVPCNTTVYFDATLGALDMTVCNRSNDIVWGCYGANVVHMSFLQEFIARAVGLPVGKYIQFSNNFHAYVQRPDVQRLVAGTDGPQSGWSVVYEPVDHYTCKLKHFPILEHSDTWERWLEECALFAADPLNGSWADPFFAEVAYPMMEAHALYKAGFIVDALGVADGCAAPDWRIAAVEWLQRRRDKQLAKEAS